MSAPAQISKLFALPAEVRNYIYELVFVSIFNAFSEDGAWMVDWTWKFPSLLQTCHQIRSEALKMYYASNIFYLYSDDWISQHAFSATMMVRWLRAIGSTAREGLNSIIIEDGKLMLSSPKYTGDDYLIRSPLEIDKNDGDDEAEEEDEIYHPDFAVALKVVSIQVPNMKIYSVGAIIWDLACWKTGTAEYYLQGKWPVDDTKDWKAPC
jgi:hypothetical protein